MKISEAIELEKVYINARKYIQIQPGVVDRVEKGDVMKPDVLSVKTYIFYGAGTFDLIAEVHSEKEPKVYTSRIQFYDVLFGDDFTKATPVKVKDSKNKNIFWMQRFTPNTEIAVRCSCPDFRFRFMWYLKDIHALLGKPIPYVRKTHRKGQNVGKVKAVCKHLFAIFESLVAVNVIGMEETYSSEIDFTRFVK